MYGEERLPPKLVGIVLGVSTEPLAFGWAGD